MVYNFEGRDVLVDKKGERERDRERERERKRECVWKKMYVDK